MNEILSLDASSSKCGSKGWRLESDFYVAQIADFISCIMQHAYMIGMFNINSFKWSIDIGLTLILIIFIHLQVEY